MSNSRREFLSMATVAGGMLAMSSLVKGAAGPDTPRGNNMTNAGRAEQIFRPEFQFGLGGVPIGNEFEVVTDEDSMMTLEASWKAGIGWNCCRTAVFSN